MSATEIRWDRTWEWGTTETGPDGVPRVSTHSVTRTMGTFRFENWAVGALISSQTQRQYGSLHDAPNSAYPDSRTNLKPRVDKALSETCQKKLNELLSKLKSNETDIVKLAEKAYSGDGIALSLTDDPVQYIWEKGIGLFSQSVRRNAPAGETRNRNSIVINRNIYGQDYETLTFLHELLHTTKRGNTHRAIARSIADIVGVRPELDKYLKKSSNSDRESSGFINGWLNEHCLRNPDLSKPWAEILRRIGV